jgi:hypothetical protein
MIAPPLVAFITLQWGWRASFVVTGLLGFMWVALFLLFRSRHPQMDLLDRPGGQSGAAQVPWTTLLRYRQTWAVFVCRFFADPLWYFFVFWIPEFLTRERGLNLAGIGLVAWIPFLVADVANFGGGYLSMRLLERQSRAQDHDGGRHVLLPARHRCSVQQLAVLDHDDDLDLDLLLDPVVDHRSFAAGRLFPAARGRLGLRLRRNRIDSRVDDQHLGGRRGAGCDEQLRAGVHRPQLVDADRPRPRILFDAASRTDS